MKIVDFVPKSIGSRGLCTLNINVKGMLIISPTACELLELKSGDEVVISYDRDDEKAWFIRKATSENTRRIILRSPSQKANKYLFANCASLTVEMFTHLKPGLKSAKMLISKEPTDVGNVKYFPIILSSAK